MLPLASASLTTSRLRFAGLRVPTRVDNDPLVFPVLSVNGAVKCVTLELSAKTELFLIAEDVPLVHCSRFSPVMDVVNDCSEDLDFICREAPTTDF